VLGAQAPDLHLRAWPLHCDFRKFEKSVRGLVAAKKSEHPHSILSCGHEPGSHERWDVRRWTPYFGAHGVTSCFLEGVSRTIGDVVTEPPGRNPAGNSPAKQMAGEIHFLKYVGEKILTASRTDFVSIIIRRKNFQIGTGKCYFFAKNFCPSYSWSSDHQFRPKNFTLLPFALIFADGLFGPAASRIEAGDSQE
jgi:hypothetical protein